jgi:hypothetical protein
MKLDKALKIRDRAISTVRRTYEYVVKNHVTQKQELEMLQDIRTFLGDSKAPRWVTSYVEGFRDCFRGTIMAEKLEFLYTCRDHLVSTTKDHELDMAKHGITDEIICKESTKSGFYWKGSHKEYFIGQHT